MKNTNSLRALLIFVPLFCIACIFSCTKKDDSTPSTTTTTSGSTTSTTSGSTTSTTSGSTTSTTSGSTTSTTSGSTTSTGGSNFYSIGGSNHIPTQVETYISSDSAGFVIKGSSINNHSACAIRTNGLTSPAAGTYNFVSMNNVLQANEAYLWMWEDTVMYYGTSGSMVVTVFNNKPTVTFSNVPVSYNNGSTKLANGKLIVP